MRVSIPLTSTKLHTLLWGKKYDQFTADKEVNFYRFTIQNLWKYNVYIENWENATVENWYKLFPWNDLEIKTDNIHRISFISETEINDNIRIITT